ncbi:MAG: hypothetical protein U1G08_04815 [Verrucomicrobiota bacterium]
MRIQFAILFLVTLSSLAQPYTGPDPSALIDVDINGAADFSYNFSQEQGGGEPVVWSDGFGLSVGGSSRILRYSDGRIHFLLGEEVSNRSVVYSRTLNVPGRPPEVFYDLGISGYTSVFLGEWVNRISPKAFDGLREFILGVKVPAGDGVHFGWIRFAREDSDMRTPFQVANFDAHPVPGEAIAAGRRPDLPLPTVRYLEDTLELKWDTRWGALGVEYSTNLSTGEWKSLPGNFVGGTSLDLIGDGAYLRLVWP